MLFGVTAQIVYVTSYCRKCCSYMCKKLLFADNYVAFEAFLTCRSIYVCILWYDEVVINTRTWQLHHKSCQIESTVKKILIFKTNVRSKVKKLQIEKVQFCSKLVDLLTNNCFTVPRVILLLSLKYRHYGFFISPT